MKSSIPKISQTKPIQQEKAVVSIPQAQALISKAEVERALRLEREEEISREALRLLRDHPNVHLSQIQTEVALLNRKVEPLLKRIEEAAKNVKVAN